MEKVKAIYGEKEQYASIVKTWREYEGQIGGRELLALVDTIEPMSKMIYEHYRSLEELFKMWMKEYLSHPLPKDIMAGLAILKACNMGIVHAEHYAKIGKDLLGDSVELEIQGQGQVDEHDARTLALVQWDEVKQMWGIEDER